MTSLRTSSVCTTRRALTLGGLGLLAGCSPTTYLNLAAANGSYDWITDLAYGDDPRQRLDVYRPRDASMRPARGWPVVLFFYGGSWRTGDRAMYRFAGEALASQGMLAIVADYRLYPAVRYPDFVRDSALAAAWAHREAARYDGDATRFFVMGHSAGGYNAAMLALDPRWLAPHALAPNVFRGWIGLSAPYDFLPIQSGMIQPIFSHPDTPADSQPIVHVRGAAPRAFIGTSASDFLVDPERNARQLAARLAAAQVPTTLRVYDGVNHFSLMGAFSRPMRFLAPVLEDVAAFIRGDEDAV